MDIVYNRQVTDDEVRLFKLMEEFVYTYLEDKDLFDKITIQFKETEDKKNGLCYVGQVKFKKSQPFQPKIKISDYSIRLSANACILNGRHSYYSYEKYRFKVIFHELAHLVRTYNNPEQFHIMVRSNRKTYDKEEENKVNELAGEFLKIKNII